MICWIVIILVCILTVFIIGALMLIGDIQDIHSDVN